VNGLASAGKLLEAAASVYKAAGLPTGEGTALLGLSECHLHLAYLVNVILHIGESCFNPTSINNFLMMILS
jgi:hypothetical protein